MKKHPVRTVLLRSLLVLGTVIGCLLITVFSAGLLVSHGPSRSLRDMLVISAKQASATKWVPRLFLSAETVDGIVAASEQIDTDTVDAADYIQTGGEATDEWANYPDGLRLDFVQKSKFKAYMLLVRDPKRVQVGVSSADFATATAGARIFDLVEKYHAVAAINGGEFADPNGMGTGATPMGLTFSAGRMVWNDGASRTFIGFDRNDRLLCRNSMTAAEAQTLGIRDAVCFQQGNALIQHEGEKIRLNYGDRNTGTAQRTAIGQRADGTVLFLVTDGRSAESIGATRNDVIALMAEYGAVEAGMLDGGSSAMLYYRDYFDKCGLDKSTLDTYQQKGLVNRYKAFVPPRDIPTYFIVTEG